MFGAIEFPPLQRWAATDLAHPSPQLYFLGQPQSLYKSEHSVRDFIFTSADSAGDANQALDV